MPLHVFIRRNPLDPPQMRVIHFQLGPHQLGMLFGELIAIGEKQFAFIRGEAKTRALRQQAVRDSCDFAGLAAVQIQEEDVVAAVERRGPPMRQNDEVLAALVGDLTDRTGPEAQNEVTLVLAALAAEEHRGRVFRIDQSGAPGLIWTADRPEVFALAADSLVRYFTPPVPPKGKSTASKTARPPNTLIPKPNTSGRWLSLPMEPSTPEPAMEAASSASPDPTRARNITPPAKAT